MSDLPRRRFLQQTLGSAATLASSSLLTRLGYAQAADERVRIFLDPRRVRADLDRNLLGAFLGEVRLPASWRVLYKDGPQSKAVDVRDTYSVEKDRFNTVTFTPVTTSGLRLEVTMRPESSAGLQEWRVK
jgi:hypothetical protein